MKELTDLETAFSNLFNRLMSDKTMQFYAFIALLAFIIITQWQDLKLGFIKGWTDLGSIVR